MEQPAPARKSLRLKQYDYNSQGAYFLTFCTYDKHPVLSRIVGAIHESPEVRLTARGKIVANVIAQLPERLGVEIVRYVIMPNHVHLMLVVNRQAERAIHESPLRRRSVVSKAIGYIKMNASKEIRKQFGDETVWQRNFYDHIVRDEEDYCMILKYIDENPIRWNSDRYFEEL